MRFGKCENVCIAGELGILYENYVYKLGKKKSGQWPLGINP